MSKYKNGAEYSHKLLAGIYVAKSFKSIIIHLFPDQLK